MAIKRSCVRNIVIDSAQLSQVRNDLTKTQWENGVATTLLNLYVIPPCQTSRIILDAIKSRDKTVTIIPERNPLLPNKADANAHADPTNPQAATASGKPVAPGGPLGSGAGSPVILQFAAQDWAPAMENVSLRAGDETLLHELIHALRQISGLEDPSELHAPFPTLRKGDGSVSQLMAGAAGQKPTKHSQIYNHYEEFVAILITNIYRSENRRPGLKRDHLGDFELNYPLTNARNFLTAWRPQIEQIQAEMPVVCDQLARVNCHFNPIFELSVARGK